MRRIRALLVAAAVSLTGCATSIPSASGPGSPAPAPTVPASQAEATITASPTSQPRPTAIPRPNDIPTDGTCDPNHACLGLLVPGTYHTEAFVPGFGFAVAEPGWENLQMSGGIFDLTSITAPGDRIAFLARARATEPDGSRAPGIESSVAALAAWLPSNGSLSTTPAEAVTIGGLQGRWWDVTVSPTATSTPTDCPTLACVMFLQGRDPSSKPTWVWDVGVASSERLRLYLLDWKEDVVAIVVDSLDGTTFDVQTKAADAILSSVVFDEG